MNILKQCVSFWRRRKPGTPSDDMANKAGSPANRLRAVIAGKG